MDGNTRYARKDGRMANSSQDPATQAVHIWSDVLAVLKHDGVVEGQDV